MWYLTLKVLHIVAVISWMAGLLYLPRLFVYHADAAAGSAMSETFKVMERRLYRFIMGPAMAVTWIAGAGLPFVGAPADWGDDLWLWAKLAFVVLLTGFHYFLGRCLGEFAEDRNQRSSAFFRKINEIPTVLMIVIVILVVVRPF